MSEDKVSTEKTAFNNSIAKLQRIDTQRKILQSARLYHDWPSVASCLYSIRNEINEKLSTDERTAGDNFENLIRDAIDKARHDKKVCISVFVAYERWLGDMEFKYGYSMIDKPDSRFAMGN